MEELVVHAGHKVNVETSYYGVSMQVRNDGIFTWLVGTHGASVIHAFFYCHAVTRIFPERDKVHSPTASDLGSDALWKSEE